MESVNEHPRRFALRIEADGSLLYDRARHGYFRRTAAEAFLLVASRELPRAEARRRLGGAVGAAEARRAEAALRVEGILGAGRRFDGEVVRLSAVPGAYGAPLVAHLGVTLACNFACVHCYSSSGKRARDELSLHEVEDLVDQLAAMGCRKLVLGGGEPFLRSDLPAVVRHADERGVDCFVHTNGSRLSEALLEELAACPPAGLAVSLDGASPESNDAIRGPHAFARAMAGVDALRRHYPPGFNLSMTVTPRNARETPAMVDLASRVCARLLLLRPAYPAGEAVKSPGLVCDRQTFAEAIDRARARAAELGVALDAPHPGEQGVPDFEGFGCVAARVVLGIDPSGNVTPCLNLPGAFVSGNVRERSLAELWQSGHAFRTIRAVEPNPQCATCRHYDTCRGGCRVRSLFSGNGLAGPDSWCHYEPRPGAVPAEFRRPASFDPGRSSELPIRRPSAEEVRHVENP